jgi:SAM-dependent methyltransferase
MLVMSLRAFKRRLKRRFSRPDHKAYVGPALNYELLGRLQFEHLKFWGLSPRSYLLDIGCGCFRGGKFAIELLDRSHYYGIEPNTWLIKAGIKHELGRRLNWAKRPILNNNADFSLSVFGRQFDFVLAQSIMSHACQRQIRKILSEAAKVMSEHAVLLATYFQDDRDHDGDEWVYPRATRYTFDFMCRAAAENALECAPVNWYHPRQSWLVFYRSANSRLVLSKLAELPDRPSISAVSQEPGIASE